MHNAYPVTSWVIISVSVCVCVCVGMDISPIDLINIQRFATRVIGLVKYRSELSEYLSKRMNNVAPNLTTLIGEQVCMAHFKSM